MNLLALETSTEACSVALHTAEGLFSRHQIAPRQHAALALPWVSELLAEAGIGRSDLHGVAVGRGPGAFTGVRLGVSLAQGLALALDVPVLPVSTLEALAMQAGAGEGEHVISVMDARMDEAYWCSYRMRAGVPVALAAEALSAPETIGLEGEGWHGVGTGFAMQGGLLATRLARQLRHCDANALPTAAAVARLAMPRLLRGEGLAAEQLEPAYLRNNVALTLAQQQALRAG